MNGLILTKKKTSKVGFFLVLKQQFHAERRNTKKYGVTIISKRHQSHLTVTLEHIVLRDETTVVKTSSTIESDAKHVSDCVNAELTSSPVMFVLF